MRESYRHFPLALALASGLVISILPTAALALCNRHVTLLDTTVLDSGECIMSFADATPHESAALTTTLGSLEADARTAVGLAPSIGSISMVDNVNTFDDFVVSGPPAPSVNVTVHYVISASAFVAGTADLMDAQVTTQIFAAGELRSGRGLIQGAEPMVCIDEDDLAGFCPSPTSTSLSGTLARRSMTFATTPNQPFLVQMVNSALASESDLPADGNEPGETRAFGVMSFASQASGQGPAFVAPAGYSVDSLSAGIENGIFDPAPRPVPGVSGFGLVIVAGAVAGIGARRLSAAPATSVADAIASRTRRSPT